VTDRPPRLAADSIRYRFGRRTVLDAAYVDAVAGAVTALVGVSGSGKTTLFEILAGRRRPRSGTVRWDGAPVLRPSAAALSRLGLVYAPDHAWLSVRLPVRVQLGLAARVWPGGADADHARRDVEPVLDRLPADLSTGEQRLCELALAATCRPIVLVADEPFRDLEPLQREAVGRQLRRLAGDGVAVLFADHDVALVRQIADRVFAIEQGRTRLVTAFRERPVSEWYHAWAQLASYI
jgi:ABC-type multidrug transport system ATPase subunit